MTQTGPNAVDPPAPDLIRLSKCLAGVFPHPPVPDGYRLRSFLPGDELALHALLTDVFDDGSDGPFDAWWSRLRADPEFEPALCFLVHDEAKSLVAGALCWNTSFVKDLAVRRAHRRNGLGEMLMRTAFAVFSARGAKSVDLKTSRRRNADAVRLYRRLGMEEIAWEGASRASSAGGDLPQRRDSIP